MHVVKLLFQKTLWETDLLGLYKAVVMLSRNKEAIELLLDFKLQEQLIAQLDSPDSNFSVCAARVLFNCLCFKEEFDQLLMKSGLSDSIRSAFDKKRLCECDKLREITTCIVVNLLSSGDLVFEAVLSSPLLDIAAQLLAQEKRPKVPLL